METYIDAKDSKEFIISHIYLLFGCIWPLIYFYEKNINEDNNNIKNNYLNGISVSKLLGISILCVGDSFVF